jgi:putative NADH-flavin reductase
MFNANPKINNMNILILGATGRTGRLVAQTAIAKHHKVTAIIRDKSKATLPEVIYLEGSPCDPQLLRTALKGIDAVVVSLNINRTSDNPYAKVISPLTLISDTINVLIPAMERSGVKRLISVSASGVGDSWKDIPFVGRLFIRHSNIWKAYEDHERQEKIIRQSGLDWTIVRPVMLNDKNVDSFKISKGKPTGSSVSRRGIAKLILDALELDQHKKVCVTLNG